MTEWVARHVAYLGLDGMATKIQVAQGSASLYNIFSDLNQIEMPK